MKNWIISAVKSGVTHIDDLLRLDKRTTRGFVRPLYIHWAFPIGYSRSENLQDSAPVFLHLCLSSRHQSAITSRQGLKQAVRIGGRHNMPPPRDLDFWPFDLEVGMGVACDVGYPCAKFRLPRPFGFRVRADVRDIRQTDRWTDDRRRWPPNNAPASPTGAGA